MPMLTEAEIEALRITDFIFHVVHHGRPDPILLEAVPLGPFEAFFLARISETLKGNRYAFEDGSATRGSLALVAEDPGRFVAVSQDLARRLHTEDDRIKRGVLIVMTLSAGERQFHSLIKYDHEKVVAFDVQNATAVLHDVVNSFTESPNALQKSALIELTAGGGDLAIIDRNRRVGISAFFERFLGVRRQHTEAELTKGVLDATLKTVQQHQLELPPEITSRVKPKLAEIAERRGAFDADRFFGDFFGAHGTPEIRKSFDGELQRRNVVGEAFEYDRASLPTGGPKRFVTNEGIRLVVPEAAAATIRQDTGADGWTTVTIRTRRVTEQ